MKNIIFKSCIVVFLFCNTIPHTIYAQSYDINHHLYYHSSKNSAINDQLNEQKFYINTEYWKRYISDTKNIFLSPFQWNSKDFITASVIIGTTVGLYAYDTKIKNWIQGHRNDWSDKIAKYVKPFGNGRYTIPSLGLLYIYGHFFDDWKSRKVALLSIESFVITHCFVQTLKFSGHRHRPTTGDPYNTWNGPSFSNHNLSFPSGHASSAFAIATVIASEYDDIMVIPPLAYGIATLTALSRVNDNDHWTSDIFLGSAIGYFTAKAIVGFHSKKENNKLTIQPVIHSKQTALLISYKF